jgi:hypothetical protein
MKRFSMFATGLAMIALFAAGVPAGDAMACDGQNTKAATSAAAKSGDCGVKATTAAATEGCGTKAAAATATAAKSGDCGVKATTAAATEGCAAKAAAATATAAKSGDCGVKATTAAATEGCAAKAAAGGCGDKVKTQSTTDGKKVDEKKAAATKVAANTK